MAEGKLKKKKKHLIPLNAYLRSHIILIIRITQRELHIRQHNYIHIYMESWIKTG